MNGGVAVYGKSLARFLIEYVNSRLPFHHRQIPVERALQPGFFEHHWMQGLRKAAHFVQSTLCDLTNFAEFGAKHRSLRSVISGARQHGPDGRQYLSKLIVQLARDVSQGRFLRGDELLSKF